MLDPLDSTNAYFCGCIILYDRYAAIITSTNCLSIARRVQLRKFFFSTGFVTLGSSPTYGHGMPRVLWYAIRQSCKHAYMQHVMIRTSVCVERKRESHDWLWRSWRGKTAVSWGFVVETCAYCYSVDRNRSTCLNLKHQYTHTNRTHKYMDLHPQNAHHGPWCSVI